MLSRAVPPIGARLRQPDGNGERSACHRGFLGGGSSILHAGSSQSTKRCRVELVGGRFGRFAAWRKSSIRRPLARVPNGDLVFRFNLLRNPPPASADVPSLIAMNRTLYERARDMGGTRMTSSAIPFSQADWVQHYGAAWPAFQAAKHRFDPNSILNPQAAIFLA